MRDWPGYISWWECSLVTQALTVIIPLFGLNYFLTLLGPEQEQSHIAHLVFQLGRSVLISVQGRADIWSYTG